MKRILLLLALLAFFVLTDSFAAEAEAAQERAYYDVCKSIPHFEDCNAMQGMAVLDEYIYTIKKNAADNKAVIYRTNRFHGATVQMSFDGAQTVDYLGHGNDMCAAQVGADSYLFVTSMKKSVGALACFKISDTKLIPLGIYNVYTAGGSYLTISGLDVYEVNGNSVALLLAQGDLVFMGTIDVTAPAGSLYCPLGFQVDTTQMLQVAREACDDSDLEMTVQGSGFFNDTYYIPLTLHHNHATQIKADNHADSTSVIVAFPNIAAAISVMDRSVKASPADSIYIPDAGEMFFEVESVDFADGLLYFSSNRVRIDHSLTTVSVLLDPGVDMGIFTRRAAFRQDGIYMLGGANATDYFLYDPGATDKHIEAGKYPASSHTYFGLESNEEGFYYIRSMLTKEYLTVNADCTITKSAKKENDPSQLFCLTQVNWPNDPGHVAIISMLNYQYLNNEAGTTNGITTTSGKTYRLKKVKDTATLEGYLFDYTLYTACYPEETAGMTEAQAKAHFTSTGKTKGYVASIFFDPEYYLANNPDVAAHGSYGSPQGAYTHFVEYGFWEGRQGSLYYSINEYLHSGNDRLKGGDYPDKLFYIRHFRQYGANESLTRADRYGSDEFGIKKVVANFGLTPASGYEFLVDYISRNVRLSRVTNQSELEELLFDWQYYIAKNPKLTESAVSGFTGSNYEEKLHSHWIQYGIKEGRIASPYFDAAFYRKTYSDVGASNAEAYEHFVTKGFWAHRAGSVYYEGTAYLYGRNPEASVLCPHNAPVTAITPATCTLNGSANTYCCFCSKVVKTTTLPATEHSPVVDQGIAATCTTAGKTEGQHCSVCSTILVTQQSVPATGHSYSYTKVNALTHLVTCQNCEITTEAAHSYKDGFCICGESEIKEPVEDATLTLNHSLNLASDISVNLLVPIDLLEGFDMDTVYVECTIDQYTGNSPNGTTTLRLEPVLNGSYYYFTLKGLTAVQMNDGISSMLYGTKDGQPYCSPIDQYSIAAYAYSQMNHPDRPEKLKILCADLLRYGAKAQLFKNYRTDALADANMTDEHKAYLSDSKAVTFGNTNRVLNDLDNASITWAGKALDLESKVALKFVFDPANYTGDLSKLTLRVSYADIHGTPKTITVQAPELYNPDRKLYAFTLDTLLAAELRCVVSVQIFAGSTPLSPTLRYSADTYGNNKAGALLDLCKALFAYSDSAKAYFNL